MKKFFRFRVFCLFALVCSLLGAPALASNVDMVQFMWSRGMHMPAGEANHETVSVLARSLRVGDIVFIRNPLYPFQKVSYATRSWTNHVGVVIDISGDEPVVAESTFPVSRTTALSRFIAKSKDRRVAIGRLNRDLTEEEGKKIAEASRKRLGVFYDTGFDLNSEGEFCSRFVREVLAESTGIVTGKVETFSDLLSQNPQTRLTFWRIWFFGKIPWDRQTVTPASLLRDPRLHLIFDGYAK